MLKGDKLKGTLVDTALLGSVFVLACDILGRLIIMPYELTIDLIVGIIGSILFIALIVYKMKYGNKALNLKEVKMMKRRYLIESSLSFLDLFL